MANDKESKFNLWNPFCSTTRDIARTKELSQEDSLFVGFITCFFFPIGLLHLNRGVNCCKILGYVFIATLAILMFEKNDDKAEKLAEMLGLITNVTITFENINSIEQANKRCKELGVDK